MEAPEPVAQRIVTDPDPVERFNIALGYRVGDLIFLSGQPAIDETGDVVGRDNFDLQAEQVFKNLRRVLEAAGSDLSKVVKVTIFLTDMSNYPKILELRKRHFQKPYPADTIVEVNALAMPEYMIEIDAIALAKGAVID